MKFSAVFFFFFFLITGKIIDSNKNNPKQGIKKLREKLEMMTKSGQLNLLDVKTNQEIAKLVLNLYVIFEKPEELCFVGSILKKHSCGRWKKINTFW